MNEEQIKALLKQQRENCLKGYMSYYAQSTEDWAPQCVIDDIIDAPEPAFVLSDVMQRSELLHIAQLIMTIEEFLEPLHPIRHSSSFIRLKAMCNSA